MRSTALPKLTDLAANAPVIRCQFCHELVRSHEACESTREAEGCPPRRVVDAGPLSMSTGPMLGPISARLGLTAPAAPASQNAETGENSQRLSHGESQEGEGGQ
jgi:hypothetical protein